MAHLRQPRSSVAGLQKAQKAGLPAPCPLAAIRWICYLSHLYYAFQGLVINNFTWVFKYILGACFLAGSCCRAAIRCRDGMLVSKLQVALLFWGGGAERHSLCAPCRPAEGTQDGAAPLPRTQPAQSPGTRLLPGEPCWNRARHWTRGPRFQLRQHIWLNCWRFLPRPAFCRLGFGDKPRWEAYVGLSGLILGYNLVGYAVLRFSKQRFLPLSSTTARKHA